ncbi:MAG: hypothetical protein ACRCUT_13480 [Spirochaetota bacterium]
MEKNIITFLIVSILAFSSFGCEKKGSNEKFNIINIARAAVSVVEKKGFSALSAESINEEIENSNFNPDDILQRKSTLRDRQPDKSLNYRIIFEDTLENEKYRESREKKDPFRK